MRNITLFCLAFCLAPVFGQGIDPAKTVATVNGEKITASEYYRTMEFLNNVGQRQGNQFVERPPAYFALVEVITNRVVLQLAKSKGVAPTPAEVDAELAARKTQDPERFKRLTDLGMADGDFKVQISHEMAQFNLLTLGVNVTDQQISEHYGTNKLMYATPSTVKMRVIVVQSADKDKVEVALKTKKFADVAKEMSTDVTKFAGGDLPEVSIANLPQNVFNEVSRTPSGSSTAWIESGGAIAKYLVESKTESKQLPLDDKLKKQIRRQLMIDIGRNKNDVRGMMANAIKALTVDIPTPGLKKLWDIYVTDYLNALGRG
ncbi:MAG: SurA N-terminal domain-containing protein [Fimbriimonadales bacterium]